MNSALSIFDFNDEPVRVLDQAGQPWFVAADVCRVLEHSNAREAISGLDADEKGVSSADTPGGAQKINIISESGLYALIFKSRKPQAKAFRKWVTSEVLPAIRQSGGYSTTGFAKVDEGMARVRGMLEDALRDLIENRLAVGKAQAIGQLAGRYLESARYELEISGKISGPSLPRVPGRKAALPILSESETDSSLLQTMPQREMHGEGEGKPAAPAATVSSEAEMEPAQPEGEASTRGANDLSA